MFLTADLLKEHPEYNKWVTGHVVLIHDLYHDSPIKDSNALIVLHSNDDKWTITRFFCVGGKIRVSVDHQNISPEEVFSILLTKYSKGL